jgi:hypothetical protein
VRFSHLGAWSHVSGHLYMPYPSREASRAEPPRRMSCAAGRAQVLHHSLSHVNIFSSSSRAAAGIKCAPASQSLQAQACCALTIPVPFTGRFVSQSSICVQDFVERIQYTVQPQLQDTILVVYEVNPSLWQFRRGKPRLGGLTVEETDLKKDARHKEQVKRTVETRRRRKADSA